MRTYNLGTPNSTKIDRLKEQIIPLLIVFIILDLLFFGYGYQEYQFASNCKNTSAVVLRVEDDGGNHRQMLIVEYNDYTTGLPTEGVIRKVLSFNDQALAPGQRLEILYVSGMYRVYSPNFAHPNYRMVFVYVLVEVIMLGLTFKMFQSYRNEKANRKK